MKLKQYLNVLKFSKSVLMKQFSWKQQQPEVNGMENAAYA